MRKPTGLAALVLLIGAAGAPAGITRLVVEKRESPAFGGQLFGNAGAYEILSGRFYGEIDPEDPHNSIINDIQFAPRNARGMVEYSATFTLAKPVDMSRSNGVLYYTVPNRGRGAPVGSPDGRVNLLSGWQGDLPHPEGAQSILVPVARKSDGSPLTGPVLERLIDLPPSSTTVDLRPTPYVGLTYQRPLTLDTAKAQLLRRTSSQAPSLPVPPAEWAFADCTSKPFPGIPDPAKLCVKGGFDSASEYVVIYTAKDPLVLGIGYAATRDLQSFLRYGVRDGAGSPNPLAGKIKWVISRGDSQSGNFIRSYIHLGFNQDEAGRIVWDGANPHIAARQLALNFRFAIGGGYAGPFQPGSEGVLWWSDYADTARKRPSAGLLDRCTATKTCPKIFDTFGALEFWFLRESPDLVGTGAEADIPLPPNVRRYFFPGTTHGGGRGGFNPAPSAPPNGCVLAANPNPESDTMKALTVALIDWVTRGAEPPVSRYPRLAAGQLVAANKAAMGFPDIPGVPSPDGLLNPVFDYDFGPDFNYVDQSGVITRQPPVVKQVLPTLVPKVDPDGNDVGGVPSVLRQAPLGTYTGWNVIASGFDKGKICLLNGSFIPFAKTSAERAASGDPRPSLEERYGSHSGYVEIVKAAAAKAVAERFLLREDADRLIAEAAASSVLVEK
ncbi:MAG TPA: alpha/beta hydrolase domain-containing protein [Candidatus Acidoferrales bacterium]|nr:alpha/beta hydrolase domain-containing protein [Candidatus Acidoferrales bacterium]